MPATYVRYDVACRRDVPMQFSGLFARFKTSVGFGALGVMATTYTARFCRLRLALDPAGSGLIGNIAGNGYCNKIMVGTTRAEVGFSK